MKKPLIGQPLVTTPIQNNNIRKNNSNHHHHTMISSASTCSRRTYQQQQQRHLLLINLIVNLLIYLQIYSTIVSAQQYQQHNNILNFHIQENLPVNSYVGTIRSSDGQVPYLVVPHDTTTDGEREHAFDINFITGEIKTKVVLDREHQEHYYFIAICREPFAEIKCSITVKDANDNPPMFVLSNPNDTNVIVDIPEGQRGIRKLLPIATDNDTPQYGIKEFRIVSGNTPSGMFHLVEHEAPSRSSMQNYIEDSSPPTADNPLLTLQFAQVSLLPTPKSEFLIDLEVNQALDRENQSSYQLVVEAIDGGQPNLVGKLFVTVNVQDVNDNDPIFRRTLYECHHAESTAKGTSLIKVSATDADLDSNAVISYFIKRHVPSSQANTNLTKTNSGDNNISSLEVSTSRIGNININKQSQQQQYQQQQPLQPSQRFGVGGANSANKLTQSQQQPLRVSNELYETTSAETTNNNSKMKSLNGGSVGAYGAEQLFEIDSAKGEIFLAGTLDFETDQWHELTIEARDHGKPARSSQTIVKVYVLDINDDPPPASPSMEGDKLRQISPPPSSSWGMDSSLKSDFATPNRFWNDLTQSVSGWLSQINASLLFVITLIASIFIFFSACFVKIKSRQPESDYNDTPTNLLPKQSPNHSTSNDHSNNSNDIHHRHHHDRRNNSFSRLNNISNGFESINGKIGRYPYNEYPTNIYHSLHQTTKQSGPPGGGHHSLERHQLNSSMNDAHHHPGGSLTYEAHHQSQVALLAHPAHLHQSTHHLSSVHHGNNKGGTMNSMATHHSAHPSGSPQPTTPNTTHSSGMPPALHDSHHGLVGVHGTLLPLPPSVQQSQLPPTPCHAPASVFPWPQTPGSTIGCFPTLNGLMHRASNDSTMDCGVATPTGGNTQPLNRWFDLGVSSQLVYAQDWFGSYDWDYLADWTPQYHKLMPMLEAGE